jgi:hypothetical protein
MVQASISWFWFVCARTIALAAVVVVIAPSSAFAQLFEIARGVPTAGRATVLAPDIAYDPVHDCYLVVSEQFDQFDRGGSVVGHFTDRTGGVIAGPFDIAPHSWMHRVAYSADVSDGIGGRGGFVVISGGLNAQIVSYPGRLVGSPTTIFSPPPESTIWKADIAYSPTAQRFLVAVGVIRESQLVSASPASIPVRGILLDAEARPIGDVSISPDPNPAPFFHEFYYSRNEIRAVWNPVSDEFGVLLTDNKQRTLARLRTDGEVRGRTALQLTAFFGDLEVNTQTGR